MNIKRFTSKLLHTPEPVQIYMGKYGYYHQYVPTDEEVILSNFESLFGDGVVSLKQRLDFAIDFSRNGKYSKEFILEVLRSKKN